MCADSDLETSLDLTGVHKFGTTRAQIREALVSLCGTVRNKTKQLLVFMSGHGYAYSTSAESAPADILVCSEYTSLATGGDACVIIPELQEKLGYWIGGIDHYYFVDCCRTVINQAHINPVNLGLSFPGAEVGRPFIYTLYSTATGATAFTKSGFPDHLLDGLCGKGRAKGWTSDNSGMQVLFALVSEYVKKKIGRQRVDAKPGGGDGVILTLPGIPKNECSIVVSGAAPTDEFTVQLLLRGEKIGDVSLIRGPSGQVSGKPEVYGIDIRHPKRGVEQVKPPRGTPIDLYDPCVAEFKLVDIERAPKPSGAEPGSYIRMNVPPNVRVDLLNLNTNQRIENLVGSVSKAVDPGQYEVAVLEDGIPISRQHVAIRLGKSEHPEVLSFPRSAARMSILKAIGSVAENRVFNFSKTLGPIANVDMALWLSLLGASKIVAPMGVLSELSEIPTASFDHLVPGSAAVYVLAAFDVGKLPLFIGTHSAGNVQWHKAKDLNVVEDVQEMTIDVAKPGPLLVSVSVGTEETATFVTHTVPNRVTILTLSQGGSNSSLSLDPKGGLQDLRRYQYILPIAALSKFVNPELRDLVASHTDLKSIRAMFNIQALFCAKRTVAFASVSESRSLWEEALYGKWLDPMMSVIMCYEMIRRGQQRQLESQLRVVARNLWRFFELPDGQAILSLLGEPTIPSTPPLFIDGVLPFTENSDLLPFSPTKLDYASPWTTWRNVVKASGR